MRRTLLSGVAGFLLVTHPRTHVRLENHPPHGPDDLCGFEVTRRTPFWPSGVAQTYACTSELEALGRARRDGLRDGFPAWHLLYAFLLGPLPPD